jgi:AcrR family transcriptional regulator
MTTEGGDPGPPAPRDPSARDALLERVVDHVANHGLSDTSLRELSAAVGTSHRMLLYHFGSRDGLVAAIVASMEVRQRSVLEALAAGAESPRSVIERQWALLTQPELRPFVALFFEVLALAVHGRPGTEGFLADLTGPWLDLAERLGAQLGIATSRDELRLGVAVSRGLLIEVLATGDVAGPTRSLERFLDMWQRDSA